MSSPASRRAGALALAVLVAAVTASMAAVAFGAPQAAGDVAADPSLSVPEAATRSANLTATVSLPASADDSRRLVVRLEALGGGVVANRTVSVAPGESAAADFGACRPEGSYVVRVATPDGDVLAAGQVDVDRERPLVALGDADVAFDERVTRSEALDVDARLHPCVDRATLALVPERDGEDAGGAVWSATVRDADGDGAASLAWDVDAPRTEALAAGDGTTVDATRIDAGTVAYGSYHLLATTPDGDGERGRVAVTFAKPTVDVYGVNGTLPASDAIAAARDADPLGGEDAVQVVDGDWVVLRFDVDGTLSTLPANASLVAPASHGNATVRVLEFYGGPETGTAEVDLANATRRFDADSGTLWYAYRAAEPDAEVGFEYAALGDTWNATARTSVRAVDAVSLDVDRGDLLAPDRLTLTGRSALPDGTTLTVAVRTAGGVVASDEVAVSSDEFTAALDLAGVANGTNASVVVRRGDAVRFQRPVVVVSKPVLRLRGARAGDGEDLRAGESTVVRAFLWNEGNAPGNGTVVATVGNRTRTRNVTLRGGETDVVEVALPPAAVADRERVDVVVAFANETVTRTYDVARPATTPATPTATPTEGTEPWPTLAGTNRGRADGSTPGFDVGGVVAALGALLAVGRARARRGE